ncbi:MAG: NHL repeat-containing protein [Candidatus Didemnitutus sp.]|nr:NHL repeat-containing protein [Candidatus Didemnitutus sp.]
MMKKEKPVGTAPGYTRVARIFVGAFVLLAIAIAGALFMGSTPWKIPHAASGSVSHRYELAGYWDGAEVPGGNFDRPNGIAVAPDGDVYVVDARKRVIRLDASGGFRAEWGRDGSGPGEFSNPVDVAVAPDGSVFVSDYDQDRVQKFTKDGRYLLQFGRPGDGPGEFDAPAGLAVDGAGSVYVADFYHHRIQKFSGEGVFQTMIGHPGQRGDGALNYPTGIHAADDGRLIVADAYNYQLQWFDANGRPARRAAHLWPRPATSATGFNVPTGVTVGPAGFIHVADSGNHRVVLLSQQGGYVAEWKIPDADPAIHSPGKIAVSPDGHQVYAADYAGNRIIVLRLTDPASGRGR